MQRIRRKLFQICEANHPVTVRQAFYQAVSLGLVAKSEAEYDNTVGRLLSEMRMWWFEHVEGPSADMSELEALASKNGIPFEWIVDNTRWKQQPTTYLSTDEAMNALAKSFRRDLWDEAKAYVEIWVEKDALAGVLYQVTEEYDVPLMPAHGYSSISFLKQAAQSISRYWYDKPAYIYLFGDRDPSGLDAHRDIEDKLRMFAPSVSWHFRRVAVTLRQIDEWNLQTRPTKKSDPRAKNFKGESVELDAIPPQTLRDLVRKCVTKHVDEKRLEELRRTEEAERAILQSGAQVLSRIHA
ncbi:MAG: hypothetical protein ABR529_03460 [Actinomycetota bacterium]